MEKFRKYKYKNRKIEKFRNGKVVPFFLITFTTVNYETPFFLYSHLFTTVNYETRL